MIYLILMVVEIGDTMQEIAILKDAQVRVLNYFTKTKPKKGL